MFAVPEHTVLPPLAHHPLSPTALVRSISADPAAWGHLLPDLDGPVTTPLACEDARVEAWLSAWPPRYRGTLRRYGAVQGAFAVLSGLLV